jgi:Ca-activated chloride channel family protein
MLEPSLGYLETDTESPLPLEHTAITGFVTGPFAGVTYEQRFGNPFAARVNLQYKFPLPPKAAVTGFTIEVGGRPVEGELQEKAQAEEMYRQSAARGRAAALLTSESPSLFALALANVDPGAGVVVRIALSMPVTFENDTFELAVPMAVTPKFTRGAANVNPAYASPGAAVGGVSLDFMVDAGLPVTEATSPTHALAVTRLDQRRLRVGILGDAVPNKDFVLRIGVNTAETYAAAWSSADADGASFLALLVPPQLAPVSAASAPARRFLFLLDKSGSMDGPVFEQAKNALAAGVRLLRPQDTYQIFAFDYAVRALTPEPVQAVSASFRATDAALLRLHADGGTALDAAVAAGLDAAARSPVPCNVVFITDGAVDNQEQDAIVADLGARLGETRVVALGIGPAVNRDLLLAVAEHGRGFAEFLQTDDDIEGTLIRMQERLGTPVLTDLEITWAGAKVWDVFPKRVPDLYLGQPVRLTGRVLFEAPAAGLRVRALAAGKPVEFGVSLAPAPAAEPLVRRAWAQAYLDAGAKTLSRQARVQFSLREGLATDLTAWVAVDRQAITKGKGAKLTVQVAGALPEEVFANAPVGVVANLVPYDTSVVSIRCAPLAAASDELDSFLGGNEDADAIGFAEIRSRLRADGSVEGGLAVTLLVALYLLGRSDELEAEEQAALDRVFAYLATASMPAELEPLWHRAVQCRKAGFDLVLEYDDLVDLTVPSGFAEQLLDEIMAR